MTVTKAILFDLGGVLINFVGLDEIRKIIDDDPGAEGIRARWIGSSSLIDFERGKLSAEEFGVRFVDEWRLELEPDEFLGVFASWIQGALPGTHALLKELRPRFTLACLSNTNALHWERMIVDCGLEAHQSRPRAYVAVDSAEPVGIARSAISERAQFTQAAERVRGAEEAVLGAALVGERLLGGDERQCDG